MALSDEQNAMLRLLASGEQGYDDIAALLGVPVEEVRAKVIGALAQLEAEGKPAPNVPSPLPGGAKPAAEVVPPEPEPVQPAPGWRRRRAGHRRADRPETDPSRAAHRSRPTIVPRGLPLRRSDERRPPGAMPGSSGAGSSGRSS